jgi:hypothetical protein
MNCMECHPSAGGSQLVAGTNFAVGPFLRPPEAPCWYISVPTSVSQGPGPGPDSLHFHHFVPGFPVLLCVWPPFLLDSPSLLLDPLPLRSSRVPMYPSSCYGWLLIRTMIASTLSIFAMVTHLTVNNPRNPASQSNRSVNQSNKLWHQLSRVWMAIDKIWIRNRIYCTITFHSSTQYKIQYGTRRVFSACFSSPFLW